MRRLSLVLREYRRRHELSQREVAEKLGVSRSYVAAIEQGYVPQLEVIERIAELTGEPLSYLLERVGEGKEEWTETPVRGEPTTRQARAYAEQVLREAGLRPEELPEELWEFLNTREAHYLRVRPEEVRILKSIRLSRGPKGTPRPEDYLEYLLHLIRAKRPD